MKTHLFDKKGLLLTNDLYQLGDEQMICLCDSMDLLPMGSYIDTEKIKLDWMQIDSGNLIVNKKDLINYRDDLYKTIGCCGPDGSIMNIASKNNLVVGCEGGDCMMPYFVQILKQNVVIKMTPAKEPLILVAHVNYKGQVRIIDRIVVQGYDELPKLEQLVEERLEWEIWDVDKRNKLKEQVQIAEFKQIKHFFKQVSDHRDRWLFTKYDDKK